MSGLQVVVEPGIEGFELLEGGQVNTGSAVAVYGELVGSPGGKQKVRVDVGLHSSLFNQASTQCVM